MMQNNVIFLIVPINSWPGLPPLIGCDPSIAKWPILFYQQMTKPYQKEQGPAQGV
jgi:hypothetical protein